MWGKRPGGRRAASEPATGGGFQLRATTSNNRLHAPDCAVVQHHFDAVRVRGTFGEDAGHDALRQRAGALVLLLHDLHAQTRANVTAYWHTHSIPVSFRYGVQSDPIIATSPEETPGNSHAARSGRPHRKPGRVGLVNQRSRATSTSPGWRAGACGGPRTPAGALP